MKTRRVEWSGGTVVLSPDSRKKGLIAWVVTLWRRANRAKIVEDAARRLGFDKSACGWTVSALNDGCWVLPSGKLSRMKSFEVEICGVESSDLTTLAIELCLAFDQLSAMVRHGPAGSVRFIG